MWISINIGELDPIRIKKKGRKFDCFLFLNNPHSMLYSRKKLCQFLGSFNVRQRRKEGCGCVPNLKSSPCRIKAKLSPLLTFYKNFGVPLWSRPSEKRKSPAWPKITCEFKLTSFSCVELVSWKRSLDEP